MSLEIWIALAAANFVACIAPGQNAAMVTGAAARSDLSGGLSALSGILLAETVWAIAAVELVFHAREVAGDTFVLMQLGSAVVLIWFGWTTLKECTGAARIGVQHGHGRLVFDGLIVGFANPLALLFFLSVFPAFVPAGSSGIGPGLFFISAIVFSSAAGLFPYLAAGDALKRFGLSRPLNIISGAALLCLGGVLGLRIMIL